MNQNHNDKALRNIGLRHMHHTERTVTKHYVVDDQFRATYFAKRIMEEMVCTDKVYEEEESQPGLRSDQSEAEPSNENPEGGT